MSLNIVKMSHGVLEKEKILFLRSLHKMAAEKKEQLELAREAEHETDNFSSGLYHQNLN